MMILLAILATYRAARMIALEEGPLDAFTRLRSGARGVPWLDAGINCVLCVSFWVAWIIAALLPWQGWASYVLSALALSGGASALHLYLEREP